MNAIKGIGFFSPLTVQFKHKIDKTFYVLCLNAGNFCDSSLFFKLE